MQIKLSDIITLELIGDHHVAQLFGLLEHNRLHLGEWLPWVERMKSVEDFERFVLLSKQKHAEGTEASYVIVENEKVIGRAGLYHFNHKDRIASIGYWICKEHEGRGIITKACRALISYGFRDLGLNRIEIKCGTGNTRSRAVPERLGFTLEGIIRQGELINNKFIDLYLYSMLRDEWEASSQSVSH